MPPIPADVSTCVEPRSLPSYASLFQSRCCRPTIKQPLHAVEPPLPTVPLGSLQDIRSQPLTISYVTLTPPFRLLAAMIPLTMSCTCFKASVELSLPVKASVSA